MTYERLADFVQHRMRMSHIYQPVMLLALLRGGGRRSTTEIARSILAHDVSQVEYYEKVNKNMVGRVLRIHGIVEKDDSEYFLVGYDDLDDEQVAHVVELCQSKLDEYKERCGKRIWQHRRVSAGYVSGTLRYEVLRRARFRCELCGVSADVRALEVDHIIPRNKNGTDDPDNLQALCYSCNAMKRDRDATDFRKVRESYDLREPGCAFCEMPNDHVIVENELAYAVRDAFPVTRLHTGDSQAARIRVLRAWSRRAQCLPAPSRTREGGYRASRHERGGVQRRHKQWCGCWADGLPLPRTSGPTAQWRCRRPHGRSAQRDSG